MERSKSENRPDTEKEEPGALQNRKSLNKFYNS